MAEPTPGTLFHTKDGKTVFVDPKTNEASIFDGILTIDKILEPESGVSAKSNKDLLPILKSLPGLLALDFLIISAGGKMPGQQQAEIVKIEEGQDESPDILGPKDYYILAPEKPVVPLALGSCPVRAWVSEYRNGHKPDYQGFEKHQILPEQWAWLNQHNKSCSVVAWYDSECPAFVALACQTHAKLIKPVLITEGPTEAPIAYLGASTGIVQGSQESILAEERDV